MIAYLVVWRLALLVAEESYCLRVCVGGASVASVCSPLCAYCTTPSPSPQPLSHPDSDGKHHLLPGPLRLCAFARGPARTLPSESIQGEGLPKLPFPPCDSIGKVRPTPGSAGGSPAPGRGLAVPNPYLITQPTFTNSGSPALARAACPRSQECPCFIERYCPNPANFPKKILRLTAHALPLPRA
jgi:hypothetical protein